MDYDKAVETARQEGKDLLVDFTGSDWCVWCRKLDAEVFAHQEFLDAAKKNFVLVLLDFPHAPEAVAQVPNAARNKELQAKHRVQRFPTVLLLTADGDAYATTGYQEGGAAGYVAHLEELRTTERPKLLASLALVKEYGAAAQDGKAALLEKAVAGMETQGEGLGAVALAPVVRDALGEGKDAALEVRAVAALCGAGQCDAPVQAAALRADPRNEKGLREKAVYGIIRGVKGPADLQGAFAAVEALDATGPVKDRELATHIYASAAFWNHKFLSNPVMAKKYARKLKALELQNPQIDGLIETILGDEADETEESEGCGEIVESDDSED
jgi:hypothetical protein